MIKMPFETIFLLEARMHKLDEIAFQENSQVETEMFHAKKLPTTFFQLGSFINEIKIFALHPLHNQNDNRR
ncbi:hypothetical protein JNUCC74_11300 [Cerasibacillus sp. JNUCC 74]